MINKQEIVKLKRDVGVILIPFGTTVVLPKDTEVTITQALGGTYTVAIPGAIYRVEGKDADALGKTGLEFISNHNEPTDKNANLEDRILDLLKTCYDPEIPVNIVDLGLVYNIDIQPDESEGNRFNVVIYMTFTSPGCSMGPIIIQDAKLKLASLTEIKSLDIKIVFDPPWDRSMMSDQAKLDLGMF